MRVTPQEHLVPLNNQVATERRPWGLLTLPTLALIGAAGVFELNRRGEQGDLARALENHSIVTSAPRLPRQFGADFVDGKPRFIYNSYSLDHPAGEGSIHTYRDGGWTTLPPIAPQEQFPLQTTFLPGTHEPLVLAPHLSSDKTRGTILGAAHVYRNDAWVTLGVFEEGYPLGVIQYQDEMIFYGGFKGVNEVDAPAIATLKNGNWSAVLSGPEALSVDYIARACEWQGGIAFVAHLGTTTTTSLYSLLYYKDGKVQTLAPGTGKDGTPWYFVSDLASFGDELFVITQPSPNSQSNSLQMFHFTGKDWEPRPFAVQPLGNSSTFGLSAVVRHDVRSFLIATRRDLTVGPFFGAGLFRCFPDGRYEYPLTNSGRIEFDPDSQFAVTPEGRKFIMTRTPIFDRGKQGVAVYQIDK